MEKCTVAMQEGPCSQHVTGNMSRLNQPQSAMLSTNDSVPFSTVAVLSHPTMANQYTGVCT